MQPLPQYRRMRRSVRSQRDASSNTVLNESDSSSTKAGSLEDQNVLEKRETPSGTIIVRFHSDEGPVNPKNWPRNKKWTTTGNFGCTGFLVGWTSAIDSAVIQEAQSAFRFLAGFFGSVSDVGSSVMNICLSCVCLFVPPVTIS